MDLKSIAKLFYPLLLSRDCRCVKIPSLWSATVNCQNEHLYETKGRPFSTWLSSSILQWLVWWRVWLDIDENRQLPLPLLPSEERGWTQGGEECRGCVWSCWTGNFLFFTRKKEGNFLFLFFRVKKEGSLAGDRWEEKEEERGWMQGGEECRGCVWSCWTGNFLFFTRKKEGNFLFLFFRVKKEGSLAGHRWEEKEEEERGWTQGGEECRGCVWSCWTGNFLFLFFRVAGAGGSVVVNLCSVVAGISALKFI